jgi:hypothetical protein
VLECDRDKGEIYVRPVGDSAKPINLFVSSAQRHLHAAAAPFGHAGRHHRHPRQDAQGVEASHSGSGRAGPSPNPVRAMKALLVAMASDRVPPDVRVEETHRSVPLWIEARFSLVRQYEGRGLIGEKYLLQNVSNAPMVLAEQEFDREAAASPASYRAPQPAPRREHQRLRDPPRRGAMTTPRSPSKPCAACRSNCCSTCPRGNASTPCSAPCWPAASGCSG